MIICPGADCNVELTYEELRANSESDTFAMSDSSPTKADLDMTTFFCKKPARAIPISKSVPILSAGKVSSFPMLVLSTPRCPHLTTDDSSFFSCFACRTKTCPSCEVEFHSGFTCAQYQESRKEQTFSDVRTKAWLSRKAKLCVCGRWVQKTVGCDHITCKCGEQWCYICGVSYKLIGKLGNVAHNKNCMHHRSMSPSELINEGLTPVQI
jgi:hypothetical protein